MNLVKAKCRKEFCCRSEREGATASQVHNVKGGANLSELSPLLSSHFSSAPNLPSPSSRLGMMMTSKTMRMRKDCRAKCFLALFATSLLLNPWPGGETGMPYLHLTAPPWMPTLLSVNFPQTNLQPQETAGCSARPAATVVFKLSLKLLQTYQIIFVAKHSVPL